MNQTTRIHSAISNAEADGLTHFASALRIELRKAIELEKEMARYGISSNLEKTSLHGFNNSLPGDFPGTLETTRSTNQD